MLLRVTELITDPKNQPINDIVDKIGLTSIATTAAIHVGEYTEIIEEGLALTDYMAIVGIAGGIVYFLKISLEFAILVKKTFSKDD